MPLPKPPEPKAPPARPDVRKPWKKKTASEVVLEQGDKLKEEITELEEDLKTKRKQLAKFEEIRKIFEAN